MSTVDGIRHGDTVFPMSFAQHRLWTLHGRDPSGYAHSTGRCFTVTGNLCVPALQAALDILVARHEALRTTFPAPDDPVPWQRVHSTGGLPIEKVDLSGVAEEEIMRCVRARMERPFDLVRGDLARVSLLDAGDGTRHLVLSLHLMAADGWSMRVFCEELGAAYQATVTGSPLELPPLPVQYADWAAWQAAQLTGERRAELLRWWCGELSGVPLTVEFTTRNAPGTLPRVGGRIHRVLDAGTLDAVTLFARSQRRSVFTVLAAACAAVVGRHSGRKSFLLGIAVANRDMSEIENVLGFFVDTVPLRIDLTGDPGFAGLVHRVGDAMIQAYEHKDLPFTDLVAALVPAGDPDRSPLVQVNFAHHPAGSNGTLSLHGCTVTERPVDAGTAKFELTLRVEESADGTAVLWAEFDGRAIGREQAENLLNDYGGFLRAAVVHEGR